MRTNKLIHHKDKTKLLDAIENFDIAERVAAHVEAVNSADSLSGIVSSKRMDDSDEDDRSHTRRRQKGMPQQLTSGLTKTKKSSNQPRERRLFDINFDDLRIEGIMPRGELWLYEKNSPGNAYIFRRTDIPDTLESVKGEAKDLKRKDAQSLSGVKLRDFEVKSIAVGGGDSISVLGRLRGADQLFVLSKTTLSRAFSKEDAENFWKQNSKVLDDARKRRDSYVKWREGLKFGGNIRRSKRING
ncbi:Uncharacterized protein HZ326_28727 [Fusarium oxysporum f. sp. albedinis]|nr:Uncharacterized protein HZ326_28727 [Fusarium oxysporum f. sp. albedinis]